MSSQEIECLKRGNNIGGTICKISHIARILVKFLHLEQNLLQ